jgi:predicted RND superfamily exporter protein
MLADHRGIYGLGLLLTIGTITSMIAALIVLPVLLASATGRPAGAGASPGASETFQQAH